MRTSTLVNDGNPRTTVDFRSGDSNANNVETSDQFAFLVMFLFSSHFSDLTIICSGGVHF